jgi:hypothetical protein
MPVADDDRGGYPAGGVYRAVRERVEEDGRLHEERIAGWPVDPADHPYPMQRILDGLRAGEPIDVPPWAVPRWALSGQCIVRGQRTDGMWMYRAVVRPDDDTVVLELDDGSRWLEDNGL